MKSDLPRHLTNISSDTATTPRPGYCIKPLPQKAWQKQRPSDRPLPAVEPYPQQHISGMTSLDISSLHF